MKLLVAPGLARALLAATLMAGCASAERPLAPDEIQHTTMGYQYSTDAQRVKADANRARLAAGMTVQEVVSLLGIPTGPMMEEAISASPVFDVH